MTQSYKCLQCSCTFMTQLNILQLPSKCQSKESCAEIRDSSNSKQQKVQLLVCLLCKGTLNDEEELAEVFLICGEHDKIMNLFSRKEKEEQIVNHG